MDETHAVNALSALAQASRLQVFRLLVRNGPDGLAAGDIAYKLAISHNTLSTHLAILTRAGLLSSTCFGRSIVYRIDPDGIQPIYSITLFRIVVTENLSCVDHCSRQHRLTGALRPLSCVTFRRRGWYDPNEPQCTISLHRQLCAEHPR